MQLYSNLNLQLKVFVLLGMLACVTIGATFFATGKMRYIDDTYGNLLDGPASANLALARANRNLVYVDRSFWRLISEDSAAGIKDAAAEISDSQAYFRKQVRKAGQAMPSEKEAVEKVAAKVDAAMSTPLRESCPARRESGVWSANLAVIA